MKIRLLSISSLYPGYLKFFYSKHKETGKLAYNDHYNLLMSDTTEFAGSYTRNFVKLGLEAHCIVTNDAALQAKWNSENRHSSENSADTLMSQVADFKPDVLWIEDLNSIDTAWIEEVRQYTSLIVAYHCAPFKDALLKKLSKADFIITCTPGLKRSFEELGFRTYLVYHGFDKDLCSRINNDENERKESLTFSGSLITGGNFHNYRLNLIEELIKERVDISLYVTLESPARIRIKKLIYFINATLKKLHLLSIADRISILSQGRSKITGYSKELLRMNHSPQYGIEMYKLFNRSKVVLNMHIGVAGDYAGNMRMFEVTGAGSCLLTDNKINMSDLFDTEHEVVVYNNPEDCIKKVRWLMEHDEERERISRAGQKKTLEKHTVENRCHVIIDILEKELEGNVPI